MVELFPLPTADAGGRLPVGDGQTLAWWACGDPRGAPAVVLHGGPGQGSHPGMARGFDPARWRVYGYDQRGCGASAPHAGDPATDLSVNTTARLVADLEALREHVGVERWLVCGGSWGTALALAYAQRHPERVVGLVLVAVMLGRRAEADWMYGGAARFFPDAHARFRAAVAADDDTRLSAYLRALSDPDETVRAGAAAAWCAWEDALVSLDPGAPAPAAPAPLADRVAFARLCAHYAARAWFLDDALLRGAHRLAGVPGVLLHGRLDLSCPFDNAWSLHRAWPGSRLVALPDTGHRATPSSRRALMDAIAEFAG